MTHSALLRIGAVFAVGSFLVAGLVTVSPPEPAAAEPIGDDAEFFTVSESSSGAASQPYLTPDGQRVFFTSTASDLVAGDDNGVADVFASTAITGSDDPFSGIPTLVSVPDGPITAVRANGASGEPVASADGRYVAFTSAATNLVPGGTTPGRTHVYVRDTLLRTTTLVRPYGSGQWPEPNGSSWGPDMTDDGRLVVFTSDATNWGVVADTNGVPDGVAAYFDVNGDGVHGDMVAHRVYPYTMMPTGSHDVVVSGNGSRIAFLTQSDPMGRDPNSSDNTLVVLTDPFEPVNPENPFSGPWGSYSNLDSAEASDLSIDSNGLIITYIDADSCGAPTVIVRGVPGYGSRGIAVGTVQMETRTGWIADPQVSADGSTVAWTTTRPAFSAAGITPALENPVVRMQRVEWRDAVPGVECSGISPYPWIDVAEGTDATMSVSGRTIAFATTDADIRVVDTHAHDGLSVSSTYGELASISYPGTVDVSRIPVSGIRDHAGVLADAPIYRLPIYRLPIYRLPIYRLPIYRLLVDDAPIYRLPIYRLPIYRLPIYRLDLPGGWAQLLADTPFGGDLVQTVTLDAVLTWAAETMALPAPAPDDAQQVAARAAAELIQSLTLEHLGIDGSGIDALSLASLVLGDAPLDQIPLGGPAAPLDQWRALLRGHGVEFDLDDETALADVDAAGLDIAASGIDGVALSALPLERTLLTEVRVVTDDSANPGHGLFLTDTPLGNRSVSQLTQAGRVAIFGTASVSGTLAAPSSPILASATAADLARALPEDATFGELLFSLLDSASYPWEQLSPSTLDLRFAEHGVGGGYCYANVSCSYAPQFRFTFDAGPGEPRVFATPTAEVTVPAGTRPEAASFSGTGPEGDFSGPDLFPTQFEGRIARYFLPDTRSGTSLLIDTQITLTTQPGASLATATLTSGDLTAAGTLYTDFPLSAYDDVLRNVVNGVFHEVAQPILEGKVYYEWISPEWLDTDDFTGAPIQGPAKDEDYYLVTAAPAGKRLVISTNATDGQLSLALYAPADAAAASLGVASAGAAPGTAVVEQNGNGDPALSGADAGVALPDATLLDQAVARGDGTTTVEAASTAATPGKNLVLRVSSGNGQPSSSLYSLRVRYVDEPVETTCLAYAPAHAGSQGTSDAVTDATNTVYLFDQQRYGEIYGQDAATAVRAALSSLTGTGVVGDGTVQGAVLAIDADADVRAARDALNGNPCSMSARAALSTAINRFVVGALGDRADGISSIVVVGGDDVIPFAPVAQHTAQFGEASHAGDLRLAAPLGGGSCPAGLAAGVADPCETPLSAAARGSFVLTDDPYGLASAYATSGGYLYVPSVGMGRLVGDADDIEGVVERFVLSGGLLAADSTTSAGYGAWAELPDHVTSALAWRSTSNEQFPAEPDTWTKDLLESSVFPTGDGAQSARVVSINTHADETRMLPGVSGAHTGRFAETDLFTAAGRTDASQLHGALVFLIGCHAGNSLPASYYGDGAGSTDWVDVFSAAGGYVGNTGFGLANSVTTALSERLLALYADWTGVTVDGTVVSASEALTYAKTAYLGGLGMYSGYDEKVLMQAVYYGLPMYSFTPAATLKSAPLPDIPDDLGDVDLDGTLTASLSLQPSFTTRTAQDGNGRTVQYVIADGQDPLAVAGQPVLPRIVSQLNERPDGLVPRGAVLTGLTSTSESFTPAIAEPDVGVPETTATRTGIAFPSSFATVTAQQTPTGPVDLLVVTPARVTAPIGGAGTIEKFTDLDLEVTYGLADSEDDTPPIVTSIDLGQHGHSLVFGAEDGIGGSGVARMVLLVQREGASRWEQLPLTASPALGAVDRNGDPVTDANRRWVTATPDGAFRWILQVVDAAGNVTTESSRGHLTTVGARAPEVGDIGDDVSIALGERVTRTVEIAGVAPTDLPTAVVVVSREGADAGATDIVATAPAAVTLGHDGKARASIDQTFTTSGVHTVTLRACVVNECGEASFDVTVAGGNRAPRAEVLITSDRTPVDTTATITAVATGNDPEDGDDVELQYAWTRNGQPIAGSEADPRTLDLTGIAVMGDVFAVTATPVDSEGQQGHPATASVTLRDLLSDPVVTATAENAEGAYTPGAWSRSPVTVTFSCTSGALVTVCPAPVVVSADTTAAGTTVTGTMTDALGQTATASVLVKVDATAPTLAPVVSPNPALVGEAATATAHATDAGSGISTQGCDPPQTSTPGTKTTTCTATDVAGNTATLKATYVVKAPEPAAPVITATAKAGSSAYTQGTWSRAPVTVSFTCTSGVAVTSCPSAKTVSADTGPGGQVVVGTMKDKLGRTAEVRFTVRIDRTAPKLAPSATPSTVSVGGAVVLAANATDAGSGVVSQSCDAPDTTSKGTKTATCRAADAAGNTASATVKYTVQAPTPPPPPQPPTCRGVADRTPLEVVNADGSSVFLKTSGVPILFRACDAKGKPIDTKGFVKSVTQVGVADLAKTAKLTELWYPPITTFTYVKLADVWVGAIPTAKLSAGKKYTYRVLLADGTSFTVTFGVR